MRRRSFIKAVSMMGTAVCSSQGCFGSLAPATRIVDTHTHFYDPNRAEGVPWPGKGTPLYRPVYPRDWLMVASPEGVQQTVVVEASAWLEDNQWLLDLAKQNPCIVGVVGRLSPEAPGFAEQIKRFSANPVFRGIRLGGDLPTLIGQPDFRRGIQLMTDLGLSLDVNGSVKIHKAVAELARTYRTLRIVLNHVGSAGDAARVTDEWRSSMAMLGECENVYCKVSALGEQTEQSREHYGVSPREMKYYLPVLDHCWESFGANRLIYGSNWPVCEKGGAYADQFKVVSDFFQAKGAEACENYFWKNAMDAYRWRE